MIRFGSNAACGMLKAVKEEVQNSFYRGPTSATIIFLTSNQKIY